MDWWLGLEAGHSLHCDATTVYAAPNALNINQVNSGHIMTLSHWWYVDGNANTRYITAAGSEDLAHYFHS